MNVFHNSEYTALAVYVVFILFVFIGAVSWAKYRKVLQKRFHLLNYRTPDEDSRKITHA
ncbi:MAG: hypothetical protein WCC21_07780 [Candidatus Acidiferrales bacterium]